MLKLYRDFYGFQATVRTTKSGARLAIRAPNGRLIYAKAYKTEKGTRIAMSRLSGSWYPVDKEEVIPCLAQG